jgi:ATP-dependent DNA helicase RecG
MEIEKLVTLPESKTLEFKRDLSSLENILKTIVAFANTAGGIIIIGKASDGALQGLKDVFKAEEMLANSIADNIRPTILPELEIATVQGKDLLVVKVSYWKAPFFLKKEGMPKGVYIRLGSTSRPAGAELIVELQRSFLYDQQALSELSKEALNTQQILSCFQAVKKEINEDKLRSLGIFSFSGARLVPTIGGLILFGKQEEREQLFPNARVRCARFQGETKSHILDRFDIEGTILDAVHEVPKFIARNTRLAAKIQSMQRIDIPEYPKIAVREALINALAHADYSIGGSHIQVAIFSDRLEILNPGMLPLGFTLEDLKAGVSRVRNRTIAKVFHQLQLMEEWGSGYKRMIDACHSGEYPEPKWEELGTSIRVTFYPHRQTLFVARESPKIEFAHELMEREKRLLALFQTEKAIPFREIFKKLSPCVSERMLRYDLARLKKLKLLISKGKGRAIVWQKLS